MSICDRNFGIGGDGIIFAMNASTPDADFRMRIFNSDGVKLDPPFSSSGVSI
jgi:diaminopimelate epimerase